MSTALVRGLRRLQTAFTNWSDFRTMLEYEADGYGRTVTAVDRWYPSGKTRSRCGHLLDALPPGVREWTCQGCGDSHDRMSTPHGTFRSPDGRSQPAATESDRPDASR